MNENPHKRDTLVVALLIGSSSVFLLSLLGAGGVLLFAGISLVLGNPPAVSSSWTLVVLLSCLALLSPPGIYYAWRASKPDTQRQGVHLSSRIYLLFLLFPVILFFGTAAAGMRGLGWSLPVLHVLAAGIPVFLASALVIQRGAPLNKIRAWGSFQSGLWLSPALALFFEIALAIPLLIILFMTSSTTLNTPELLQGLSQTRGIPDTYFFEQLNALLSKPLVVASVFGYLSVGVPLIEEAVKSIALWLTSRRYMTLSLAFVSGAIAGGGYGLFEAFFLAQPGEDWMALMIARAGASIMHMFAAGLTGLGVGYIVLQRRYWRGLGLYLTAAVLHGTWNLAALGIGLIGITEVVQSPIISANNSMIISTVSGVVLFLMSMGALFGLWRLPQTLRNDQSSQDVLEGSSGKLA